MKIRFGGAAGPIAFERMRRMHNGSWDAVTVPMVLALRTSALLEPHAVPGSALIDEKFHQFAANRGAHRDGMDGQAGRNAEELSGNPVALLSETDAPDIDYDPREQKFVLRKNLLDAPYFTKLWKIELG